MPIEEGSCDFNLLGLADGFLLGLVVVFNVSLAKGLFDGILLGLPSGAC
jgi:hypothetical protein